MKNAMIVGLALAFSCWATAAYAPTAVEVKEALSEELNNPDLTPEERAVLQERYQEVRELPSDAMVDAEEFIEGDPIDDMAQEFQKELGLSETVAQQQATLVHTTFEGLELTGDPAKDAPLIRDALERAGALDVTRDWCLEKAEHGEPIEVTREEWGSHEEWGAHEGHDDMMHEGAEHEVEGSRSEGHTFMPEGTMEH